MMSIARLETLTWVLIYGGIGLGCLGLALMKNDDPLGWAFAVVGIVLVVVGVAMVWLRSRVDDKPRAEPGSNARDGGPR